MPRPLRNLPGGGVYHVMNRASMGLVLFEKDGDYLAFEKAMAEGLKRWPGLRLVAYCLMPNHFHLVLWPRGDGEVSAYVRWVAMTFAHRWHAHRGSTGRGRLFQGRFKSFPVQRDGSVLAVCRYVERNALRAGLVRRAEAWRWGSLAGRAAAEAGDERREGAWLSAWPVERGEESEWVRRVNEPETPEELEALRRSANRGTPLGGERWAKATAGRLGLGSTLRARGRPKSGRKKGGRKNGVIPF